MDNNMEILAVGLPEDIMKAKWCGDFKRAQRLIKMQLDNSKTPSFLKRRLEIESSIIDHLPLDYVYSEQEAFSIIKGRIPDFTCEEFEKMIYDSSIDWIYIDGKLTISRRFFETLCKVHRDIAGRAGVDTYNNPKENKLLDDNIAKMKADGHAACHIKLKAKLRIKDEAFKKGELVRVFIPVPVECTNMKNVSIVSSSHKIKKLSDGSTGARTAMFEEKLESNQPFFVEYEYNSCVKYTDLKPSVVSKEQPDFFTEEQYPHIIFTPTIKALRDELSKGETNPLNLAKRFYDYCTKSVIYSFMREYICMPEIPDYAALGRKGDCGVQVLLFITLCRSAGIPARWQSGLFVTPYFCGSHDWAQFYIAPYGWLFADLSMGGQGYLNGNMERNEHYFGNLDPFRMTANTEFMAKFDPAMEHLRIDPYDNQRGEVDYPDDRALKFNEIETSYDIEEFKEIQMDYIK